MQNKNSNDEFIELIFDRQMIQEKEEKINELNKEVL